MNQRANVFTIHSWADADAYRRMEELLRDSDPDLAHYSVLPERAIEGTQEEIEENIRRRIAFATAVVVMNTPGLHKRATATFEMETAVSMQKRIVVVQPPGQFQQPIPEVLDGHVYRHATWRSDVVGRAIRGEYPKDGRVFDIAEVADRRMLIGILAGSAAATSFVVSLKIGGALQDLTREMAAAGIELRWQGTDTEVVILSALLGAAVGGVIGALSGDLKTALIVAGAGAVIGTAVGLHRVYKTRLIGTAQLRVLAVEPA